MSNPDYRAGLPGWAALLAGEAEKSAGALRRQARALELLPSFARRGQVAGAFAGAETVLARAAVLQSPDEARPVLAGYAEHLGAAVAELADAQTDGARSRQARILGFANAARCVGVPLPAEAQGMEGDWLPALAANPAGLSELDRETLAFAAVAAGLPDAAARFVEGGLPASAEAGRTFGADYAGLARYLAAAVRDGAPAADVEPAFADFLLDFPVKLASETTDWPALLWCGRAVLSRIGGLADGEVAAELHRRVRALA